jgi:hypothetical protein
MAAKWFTPESARAALVCVRPVAERMSRLYRGLESHPAEIGSDKRVDPEYLEMVQALRAALCELDRAGVRIQDARSGRVDFPARRSGREVLLRWQVGEAQLDYWHELGDSSGRRQAVDENGPWDAGDDGVDRSE